MRGRGSLDESKGDITSFDLLRQKATRDFNCIHIVRNKELIYVHVLPGLGSSEAHIVCACSTLLSQGSRGLGGSDSTANL